MRAETKCSLESRSRSWRLLSTLLFAGLLTGCAVHLGAPFNTDEVKTIQVGATTQAQVVERFGQPFSKGLKDGRPLWTYFFAHVPVTGGTARGTLLSIEFDDKGVVSSYSYVPY